MKSKQIGVGVGILINQYGNILLGVRADNSIAAPGGKVEFGETWKQAVVRELKEETNLDCLESDIEFIEVTDDFYEGKHFITINCVVRNVSGELKSKEKQIHSWKWYPLFNLDCSNLFLPTKNTINAYLKYLSK